MLGVDINCQVYVIQLNLYEQQTVLRLEKFSLSTGVIRGVDSVQKVFYVSSRECSSSHSVARVNTIVLGNPEYPTFYYPRLQACVSFCHQHLITFVSDTTFPDHEQQLYWFALYTVR